MSVINISNMSIVERDDVSQLLEFTVTLDAVPTAPVTFFYYTQDGTASTANGDYEADATSRTIPVGAQTAIVQVRVYADNLIEGDETFQLVVLPGANATLPQNAPALIATATIFDDDDGVNDPAPGPMGPATLLFGQSNNAAVPTISVRNVSVIEGNNTSVLARFLVTLDRPATADVTFQYYLGDGSASGINGDYDGPTNGNVTIQAGRQSTWIEVRVYADTAIEANETFNLVMVNARNAVFAGAAPALVATATILDNDSGGAPSAGVGGFATPIYAAPSASATAPTLSVRDTLIVEGNNSSGLAYFLITLDRPATTAVTFSYTVTDATASGSANDFESDFSTATIPAGSQSTWISTRVYADTRIEGDETFRLVLSGIANAVFSNNAPVLVATGTISDNDSGGAPVGGIGGLAALVANPDSIGGAVTARIVNTFAVEGGDSETVFVYVVLSQPATSNVQLDFRTLAGEAANDVDYSGISGTLTIAAGQMSGFVRVFIRADTLIEGNEAFQLEFFNPRGAIFENGLARMSASIVIVDDDDGVADTAVMGPQFAYRNVTATEGADVLTGSYLADVINGLGGSDIISGLAGNDTLKGGLGNDALYGGSGIDTADYSDKTTSVVVTLNGATGVAVSVGGVVEDSLFDIENLIGGSGNDTLTGDQLANQLTGGLGGDILRGAAGNDQLIGGGGADTLDGGSDYDFARYDASAAGVVVRLDSGQGLNGDAQGDLLSNFEGVIGSAQQDFLIGGAAGNALLGLGGDDWLYGQGGGDELRGGTGSDQLLGGAAADLMYGEAGNDQFWTLAADFQAGVWDVIYDFGESAGNFDYLRFEGVSAAQLIIGDNAGNAVITTSALNYSGGFIVLNFSGVQTLDQLIFA